MGQVHCTQQDFIQATDGRRAPLGDIKSTFLVGSGVSVQHSAPGSSRGWLPAVAARVGVSDPWESVTVLGGWLSAVGTSLSMLIANA